MQQSTSPSIPISHSSADTISVFDEQKPLSQYMQSEAPDSHDSDDSVEMVAFQLQLHKLRPISGENQESETVQHTISPVARVEYPLYDNDEHLACPNTETGDAGEPSSEHGSTAAGTHSAPTLIAPKISIFPTDLPQTKTVSLSETFSIDTQIDCQPAGPVIHSFTRNQDDISEPIASRSQEIGSVLNLNGSNKGMVKQDSLPESEPYTKAAPTQKIVEQVANRYVEERQPGPPPVVQLSSEVDIISNDEVDDVYGRVQPFWGQYPIFESFVSLVRQKRLVESPFFFDPDFVSDETPNEMIDRNALIETDDLKKFCLTLSPRQQDSLLSFLKTFRTSNDAKRS